MITTKPTPRRLARTGLVSAALAFSLAAATAPASASAGSEPSRDRTGDKAATGGVVPVIVELNVRTRPEHTMNADEVREQRRSIAATRSAVMNELGGEAALRNLKTSDQMPLIAFHASGKQSEQLGRSPRVRAFSEDKEIELDAPVGRDREDAPSPGTPGEEAGAEVSGEAGSAGTSSNGYLNQLVEWWHYNLLGINNTTAKGWTGSGQTIAVLDTGVERNHGWLSGRVVNEACFSTPSAGSSSGHCPNGSNRQLGAGAAAPCRFHVDCAHGTHVAHTAAGVYGAAPAAKIIAVQVFHRSAATGRPTYWESDLTWALNHVYSLRSTYRIAAANMSLGGAAYTGYCDNTGDGSVNATYLTSWINSLRSVNIATVVATGNSGYTNGTGRPACISNATSVGNTTYDSGYDAVFGNAWDGKAWTGSNSDTTVDLLAPGTDICSAVPAWLDANGDGIDCGYIGTSMASPQVAGAMAVLRHYRPSATVTALETALRGSGPAVYDSRNGISRTRINVWNALSRI